MKAADFRLPSVSFLLSFSFSLSLPLSLRPFALFSYPTQPRISFCISLSILSFVCVRVCVIFPRCVTVSSLVLIRLFSLSLSVSLNLFCSFPIPSVSNRKTPHFLLLLSLSPPSPTLSFGRPPRSSSRPTALVLRRPSPADHTVRMPAAPTPAHGQSKPVPKVVVDLDAPAKERWTHVAATYVFRHTLTHTKGTFNCSKSHPTALKPCFTSLFTHSPTRTPPTLSSPQLQGPHHLRRQHGQELAAARRL